MLGWSLTILSLIGNVGVGDMRPWGWWVWIITNFGWVTYHLSVSGDNPSAFLFSAFLILAVRGLIKCQRKLATERSSQQPHPPAPESR